MADPMIVHWPGQHPGRSNTWSTSRFFPQPRQIGTDNVFALPKAGRCPKRAGQGGSASAVPSSTERPPIPFSCSPWQLAQRTMSRAKKAKLKAVCHVSHSLGYYRPRIADRVIFDKLIQLLVVGRGCRRIADATCSATTLRRRRDE
jgi:hypothetical protein